jgi:hypothetical protein
MFLRRTILAFLAIILALTFNGCAKGPQLQSISLTPVAGAQILTGAGQTAQFIAIGTYKQGGHPSTQSDITGQVTWNSSITSVATINGDGLATATGNGVTNITASSGGVLATSNLTVSITGSGGGAGSHDLTGITVTPANQGVNIPGQQAQYIALGTFDSSPTSVNLTNSAIWSTSNTTLATVNSTGLVTSGLAGSCTVTFPQTTCVVTVTATATDLNGNTHVGSATLTITPPSATSGARALTTLSIIPPAQTLNAVNQTAQFIALGTYSSAPTTSDLTTAVKWASSDTTVATVDANGLATVKNSCLAASCETTITASATDPVNGIIVGSAALTVVPGTPIQGQTLTNITVIPGTGDQIVYALGQTAQFVAVGTYSQNPVTQFLTQGVTWQSADVNVATINSSGLATALSCTSNVIPPSCVTTITASYTDPISLNQVVGQSTLTVQPGVTGPSLPSLTVYTAGAGAGTVVSSVNGISCTTGTAAGCSAFFPLGSSVTLNVTAGPTFGGWSSNCVVATPTSCTVLMNGNQTVGAIFN